MNRPADPMGAYFQRHSTAPESDRETHTKVAGEAWETRIQRLTSEILNRIHCDEPFSEFLARRFPAYDGLGGRLTVREAVAGYVDHCVASGVPRIRQSALMSSLARFHIEAKRDQRWDVKNGLLRDPEEVARIEERIRTERARAPAPVPVAAPAPPEVVADLEGKALEGDPFAAVVLRMAQAVGS